jgi:hypothetical protein
LLEDLDFEAGRNRETRRRSQARIRRGIRCAAACCGERGGGKSMKNR